MPTRQADPAVAALELSALELFERAEQLDVVDLVTPEPVKEIGPGFGPREHDFHEDRFSAVEAPSITIARRIVLPSLRA